MEKHQTVVKKGIQQYKEGLLQVHDDQLCHEEPLEFRLPYHTEDAGVEFRTLAITMRTPGQDIELASGFLYSEGIISSVEDIEGFRYDEERGRAGARNSLEILLKTPLPADSKSLERRFTTYSSCGLCGKTSIQSLELQHPPVLDETANMVDAALLQLLSEEMLTQQHIFQQTGSAHASGLFDSSGKLLKLCEDIGRHNALDKLIGHCLTEAPDILKQSILLVSGRASFELVQKTIMAGIPVMVAAGAPSSLAVETAKRFNLTLIGFMRKSGFNVYNAGWRLKTS